MIQYRVAYGKPDLSTVSIAEILRGLHRDINPAKAKLFRQEVERDFRILDFDLPTSFLAGEILAKLTGAGKNMGASDCLIAATAIHHGLDLVTSNERHFQRVADLGYPLILQDWRGV